MIEFTLHWDKQYVKETVYTENATGTFLGDDYKAIRHPATFSVPPAD